MHVLLMPLQNGFRAAISGFGMLDDVSLEGFRARIHDAVAQALGHQDFDLDFSLSRDLKPKFPVCIRCAGSERVETDRVFVQNMSSMYDEVDFNQKGSQLCPDCEGFGVTIPGF